MAEGNERYVYPGGPDALLAAFEKRRHRIKGQTDWGLPPVGANLAAGKRTIVIAANSEYRFTAFGLSAEDTNVKLDDIAKEHQGRTELELLHAYCIAHSRKRKCPDQAIRLFHRMWFEEADFLRKTLSGRWLISAMVTLGDHGETETQRRVGFAFNAFFGAMKLYEAERLYSGKPPNRPFRLDRCISKPLPMDLTPYSLRHGDLDINVLANLIQASRSDPVARVIATELLERLNSERGTIFSRLKQMKRALLEDRPI